MEDFIANTKKSSLITSNYKEQQSKTILEPLLSDQSIVDTDSIAMKEIDDKSNEELMKGRLHKMINSTAGVNKLITS